MNRITWVLALAIIVIAGQMTMAAPCRERGCCDEAATCDGGQCQLVTGTKTVTKHCWNVEEKKICPVRPGRMTLSFGPLCDAIGNALTLGGKCKKKAGCNACGEVECCQPACKAACAPKPRCGCPITVKKLVLKEWKVEKRAYRCEPTGCGPACCETPAACGAIDGCGATPISIPDVNPTEAKPEAPLPLPTAGLSFLRQ